MPQALFEISCFRFSHRFLLLLLRLEQPRAAGYVNRSYCRLLVHQRAQRCAAEGVCETNIPGRTGLRLNIPFRHCFPPIQTPPLAPAVGRRLVPFSVATTIQHLSRTPLFLELRCWKRGHFVQ